MDIVALDSLIAVGIRPGRISAEAQSFEVLLKLYEMGYRRYRLVNGANVHRGYRLSASAPVRVAVSEASAGPEHASVAADGRRFDREFTAPVGRLWLQIVLEGEGERAVSLHDLQVSAPA